MSKTIRDHFKMPLNSTVASNAFSFPKNSRFLPPAQSTTNTSFYIHENNKTRSTSFGYGERSSLSKQIKSPEPGSYNPESSPRAKRGFSFTHSKKISFIDEQANNLKIFPSPTKYEKIMFGNSHTFSFRSKYNETKQKHNVGPGEYNIGGSLNQKGSYFESKFKSSGCGKIGNQKRFNLDETFTPGPGKYQDKLGINPSGNYFNSKVSSKEVRSFGKSKYEDLNQNSLNPGPGFYYNYPSFS